MGMRDPGVGPFVTDLDVAPARPGLLDDGGHPIVDPAPASGAHEPRTIGEALRAHAERRPEQAAIVASGLAPLSYGHLVAQIDEVRGRLRQAGFDSSARIAVALPEAAQAALAIVALGCSAVALPLDPKLTLPEIETRLRLLRPNAVLLPCGSRTAARTAAEQQGIAIIEALAGDGGTMGLRLEVPRVGPALPLHEPEPAAPTFILQTSGTTADPNLVPFSHRNMLAAAKRLQGWFDLTPQDRCLCASPICYSNGVKMTLFTPLLTGGSVAFPANATKVEPSEWLDELAPTWYSVGPTLHLAILEKVRSQPKMRNHSLRFVASGGAPLPLELHDGLRAALGVPVLEHFASSETAQVCSNLPLAGRYKPGTCGIPSPELVKIVGEDGRRLPPGEEGDIMVGGPTVTAGYIDAPELNRSAFVDGWFRTGDIGCLDEDGFLVIRGRRKELINRGSEKIAPLEIDRALKRHPQVAEAAAYAVAHPRLGEDVAAAVVLSPGASVTAEELREFLGAQLAAFKVPRRIDIVDQLPKGATGKVQRKRLSAGWNESSSQTPAADWQAELLPLWKKFLKSGDISVDDDFFEKGGDSLLAMDLHMEIERLTGVELPESILLEASTVRQLAKRLSQVAPARPRPVPAVATNGGRPSLMFFHGRDGAGEAAAATLHGRLGSEQPVLAIACHGLNGSTTPREIEAVAAAHMAGVLGAQPQGAYRLAGYRDGALVALQVARLLRNAKRDVAIVALIDPPSITASGPAQILMSLLGRILPERSRPSWDGAARGVPPPLAVPLLVFSSEHEGPTWRRVSADVELINLPGSPDSLVASQGASISRYLQARLQGVGDSGVRGETAPGVV
jgi:oxalate---CoA ligase